MWSRNIRPPRDASGMLSGSHFRSIWVHFGTTWGPLWCHFLVASYPSVSLPEALFQAIWAPPGKISEAILDRANSLAGSGWPMVLSMRSQFVQWYFHVFPTVLRFPYVFQLLCDGFPLGVCVHDSPMPVEWVRLLFAGACMIVQCILNGFECLVRVSS